MSARWTQFAGLAVLLMLLASCGGEEMTSGKDQKGPSGPVTGLLINAQTIKGESVDIAHKTVVDWRLVDSSGAVLFSKADMDPAVLKMRGVRYEKRREDVPRGSSLDLGKNYAEITVTDVKLTGEKEKQTAVLTVSADGAAKLRGLPDFMKLVSKVRFVFLVGKLGA
jgi:hypothetical protein